ncbi:MAG: Rieske 2Fe-2S domain-containing protein [Ruminococcus sp.]|nr:Rieske 2Fe-2S domain-containing protein [Ruminococcus sp.]
MKKRTGDCSLFCAFLSFSCKHSRKGVDNMKSLWSSEKSWDCPCHGSRFDYTGRLTDNPSMHNLAIEKDSSGIDREKNN